MLTLRHYVPLVGSEGTLYVATDNGSTYYGKSDGTLLTLNDTSGYEKKSGDAMTGALYSAGNLQGNYIIGNWFKALQPTELRSISDKVCVFGNSGWIYYRTPKEIIEDSEVLKWGEV